MAEHRASRVAGHIQGLDIWAQSRQPPNQGRPTHLRHHHVGQHQVDGPGVALANLQGLGRMPRVQHSVAGVPEDHADHLPNRPLVLDQQNGFRAATRTAGRLTLSVAPCGLADPRQVDMERSPVSRRADNLDVAAGLLDNAVGRGQS